MIEFTKDIKKENSVIVEKSDGYVITTLFNNEVVTLTDSKEWSIWMKRVRDLSDNTIRSFLRSMDRFWTWSLYNPIGMEEPFASYQARFRNALRGGFEIVVKEKTEWGEEIEVTVHECKPLSKSTINKEIAGINTYFYFTEESELIEDHRFINHLRERHISAKSFLAGVQIKKSPLALEASGAKMKYLPPYKVPKNRNRIKYFPLELFDELLADAKPRERLLYLLCGACSARIGQALNLTLYDIDYEKKEVWLIDPKSDDAGLNGISRRVWLKDEYGIDMTVDNPHNTPDLQFKYPIPLQHEPVYWLSEKYRDLFFETLKEYRQSPEYVSEHVRAPRHPFFFTTQNGKRVHARDALSRFKTALKDLYLKHKKEEYRILLHLGFHSLRHMFGHARAELYALTGDDSIPYITMHEMGHRSFESTLIYFNISRGTMQRIIEKYMDRFEKERYNNIIKGRT